MRQRFAIAPFPPRVNELFGRSYSGTVTNPTLEYFSSMFICGCEYQGPVYFDFFGDESCAKSVVVSGTPYAYHALAHRMTASVMNVQAMWYEWVALSPMNVYRFYNRRTGTHFYTADTAERDNVIATQAATYSYERAAHYLAY